MDIFNPPERQQIIPPPPPASAPSPAPSSTTNTSSTATINSKPTPNAFEQNNNSNITVTIDTKQMQSELERRQQELEAKAAELAAREEALRQSGGEFRRQHNWPPLPSFFPLKPCFFQDINIDISPEFQRIVQLGYHIWIGFVGALLINLLASILLLIYDIEGGAQNVTFGLMMILFLVPLTYVSWFRPLYKAFKNDSSFNFMVFFFVFFMETMIVYLWSLGLPDGPCGLKSFFKTLGVSPLLTIATLLSTVGWLSFSIASTWYIVRVHKLYRSTGASITKARSEFAQGIISNQYVQQTVANAARQTVNQTFASQATSS